ncbi:MAG: hypothetical protein ACJAQ1_001583, partial [Flavobacterium sp.]
ALAFLGCSITFHNPKRAQTNAQSFTQAGE